MVNAVSRLVLITTALLFLLAGIHAHDRENEQAFNALERNVHRDYAKFIEASE